MSQDNQGKRTAGIDGVKLLNSTQRLKLVHNLALSGKAQPTRRVWIPKPGTDEQRPLGIPTMADRARQALAKLALEPEWEAKFEPNSYGFRPGRSCHDALEAIFTSIMHLPKYVLDADIAKCFDCIHHGALLSKLKTFTAMRRAIRAWLRAGFIDRGELFVTEQGAPQGGVISPLLMNIALHGLENHLQSSFPQSIRLEGRQIGNWQPKVVRYADDFVILHRDLSVIKKCQELATQWLRPMGLELKPSKTHITHTLQAVNEKVGFDFLGVEVRQYEVSKYRAKQGYKTILKPSKRSLHHHLRVLAEVIAKNKSASQRQLIQRMNPIVRGWCNYFSPQVSKQVFSKAEHLLFNKLKRWAYRRHSHLSRRWVIDRYWPGIWGEKWVFTCRDGTALHNHSDTPIRRHVKVKGSRSPYDGDSVYWAMRMGKDPMLPKTISRLMRQQKGRCLICGLFYKPGDLMEVDHIQPTEQGGKDEENNRQLLHRHCHDQKTASDRLLYQSTQPKVSDEESPEHEALRAELLKNWQPFKAKPRLTDEEWEKQWR